MAKKVAGELYESITGQLFELGRQLRQPNGYPFNPEMLRRHLQNAIEGKFITGDPKSILIKPFDLAEFIGNDWSTWKGPADGDGLSGEKDIDSRSLSLTEVKFTDFLFETCLNEGESSISGEEKLRRLKEKTEFIRFGGNVFLGLWEDYQVNKKNSVLEWLYHNYKITYMDFMGQILRVPLGYRNVLYLYRSDSGEWHWHCHWLGDRWDAGNLSVGFASEPSSLIS
jgi:hypothetical protein